MCPKMCPTLMRKHKTLISWTGPDSIIISLRTIHSACLNIIQRIHNIILCIERKNHRNYRVYIYEQTFRHWVLPRDIPVFNINRIYFCPGNVKDMRNELYLQHLYIQFRNEKLHFITFELPIRVICVLNEVINKNLSLKLIESFKLI